jgi:predicted CoA-substrate-specific enzyme activase
MKEHFLGVDVGSSYTKFVTTDDEGVIIYTDIIPTLSRRRELYEEAINKIKNQFNIRRTCATGYGRRNVQSDTQKTELISAAAGVSYFYPVHKSILDIGGEDIKIIECDASGGVIDFYMNNKCSAGTGTFITEIAQRAELEISEMDQLATKSNSDRTINSFCTVFAKSEILGWKFEGIAIEDIARGIYLSVVDRICKLPFKAEIPLYLCGGVIAHHHYLAELIAARTHLSVKVTEQPQYIVALGAAVIARNESLARTGEMRNII